MSERDKWLNWLRNVLNHELAKQEPNKNHIQLLLAAIAASEMEKQQ